MPRKYGHKIGMGIAPPHPLPHPLILRLLDWCIESFEGFNLDGKASPCWLWQGCCDLDGYPQLKWRGAKWKAHRIAYTAFVGPLAHGADVDHVCMNRSCINPAHLEAVDPIENRVIRRNGRKAVAV